MKFLVQVKDFMLKCSRVWQVLRKPSKEEFKIIARVSLIGMLIIGFIGFVIGVAMTLMKIK
ncbi:MAG: protein translocase SEC61 complex subunit gamma [archaeon]